MINLKIDNNLVVLPAEASISIEKNSPVLNDEVGAFSYPFAVPTTKNQKLLGYPGRLERAGDITDKSFILDENGIQIIRGKVEIDESDTQTGIILQSGNNEFTNLMKEKKLSDLDFGKEVWFTEFTSEAIQAKLDAWNLKNAFPSVSSYVCCQFSVKDAEGNQVLVNKYDISANTAKLSYNYDSTDQFQKYYCLQFSVGWILQKIYESANYRVIVNEITGSVFNDVCIFSKIMRVFREGYFAGSASYDLEGHLNVEPGGIQYISEGPVSDFLIFKDIMPDFDVVEFVNSMKSLLCLSIDIDERLNTVSIYFKKTIFQQSSLIKIKSSEITGWKHSEHKIKNGFSLTYKDQADELAIESEYEIFAYVANETSKPAPAEGYKDKVIHVNATNRDYKCVFNSPDYSWEEIGRLKSLTIGTEENNFEISADIPMQIILGDIDIPIIDFAINKDEIYINLDKIYISWFRGIHQLNLVNYPLMSFDRYSLNGIVDFTTSLKPAYLYETVYKEFINWKTYRARECTKYLKLTLAEVVQLQWRKRYVISGIPILLNQINFEVPYRGIVKINGFTT